MASYNPETSCEMREIVGIATAAGYVMVHAIHAFDPDFLLLINCLLILYCTDLKDTYEY